MNSLRSRLRMRPKSAWASSSSSSSDRSATRLGRRRRGARVDALDDRRGGRGEDGRGRWSRSPPGMPGTSGPGPPGRRSGRPVGAASGSAIAALDRASDVEAVGTRSSEPGAPSPTVRAGASLGARWSPLDATVRLRCRQGSRLRERPNPTRSQPPPGDSSDQLQRRGQRPSPAVGRGSTAGAAAARLCGTPLDGRGRSDRLPAASGRRGGGIDGAERCDAGSGVCDRPAPRAVVGLDVDGVGCSGRGRSMPRRRCVTWRDSAVLPRCAGLGQRRPARPTTRRAAARAADSPEAVPGTARSGRRPRHRRRASSAGAGLAPIVRRWIVVRSGAAPAVGLVAEPRPAARVQGRADTPGPGVVAAATDGPPASRETASPAGE